MSSLAARLNAVSRILAGVALLAGCLGLAGWAFDLPILRSLVPGMVAMKANSAVALILAGVSLWLLGEEGTGRGRRRLAGGCAFAVALVGLLTLGEYLFGWDLGIDQLLFRDTIAVAIFPPGRMAPNTALTFLIVGFALFLVAWSARHWLAAELLGLAAAFIALLVLVGYAYGAEPLVGIGPYTQVALPTALAFLALGLGLLFARPDRGLMGVATGDTAGGFLVRRLVLAAIVVPLVLGWLVEAGQRAGLFGEILGAALLSLSSLVVLSVLVSLRGRSLHRTDLRRRQAEVELELLLEEIDAQAKLLQTVIDDAPAGIAVLRGPDFVFEVVNPVYQAIAPGKLFPGRSVAETWPERADQVVPLLEGVLRTGETFHATDLLLRIQRTVDGPLEDVYFTFSYVPLPRIAGEEDRILMLVQETTEHVLARRLVEELARAAQGRAADLERLQQQRAKHVLGISHGLRTPLTVIQGQAQLLLKALGQAGTNGRIHRSAGAIAASAQRMSLTLRDLVDLTALENGQPLQLNRVPVELRSFVLELKGRLAGVLDVGRIGVEATEGLPPVSADPDRLERILVTLLSNAVKYSDPSTEIAVSVSSREGEVAISVTDLGAGIPPGQLPHLFEPYQRIQTGQERGESLGLGLYIAKGLVEAHGGRIWAESEVGKGSSSPFRCGLRAASLSLPDPPKIRRRRGRRQDCRTTPPDRSQRLPATPPVPAARWHGVGWSPPGSSNAPLPS